MVELQTVSNTIMLFNVI